MTDEVERLEAEYLARKNAGDDSRATYVLLLKGREARLDAAIAALPARVRRGAALLDQRVPSWRDKVAVSLLDMASNTYCVLGQVFRDPAPLRESPYDKGLLVLGLPEEVDAAEHGFTFVQRSHPTFPLSDEHMDILFDRLDAEWRAVLRAPPVAQNPPPDAENDDG